jgi:hypothetical protein
MVSKLVLERQKADEAVIMAGETHAKAVGESLRARFLPLLKHGEKLPDFELVTLLAVRLLANASQRMVAADEAHQQELQDDEAPRDARDAAAVKLYDDLVELREVVTGVYGAATARALGFTEATPEEPGALMQFATNVVAALGRAELPKPRVQGAKLNLAETAAGLRASIGDLATHRKDVAREMREAQATMAARDAAIRAREAAFREVTLLLEALLVCSGKPDLADKLRPTTRRSASSEGNGGEGDGGEKPKA